MDSYVILLPSTIAIVFCKVKKKIDEHRIKLENFCRKRCVVRKLNSLEIQAILSDP